MGIYICDNRDYCFVPLPAAWYLHAFCVGAVSQHLDRDKSVFPQCCCSRDMKEKCLWLVDSWRGLSNCAIRELVGMMRLKCCETVPDKLVVIFGLMLTPS